MEKKWFYGAQNDAMKRLHDIYDGDMQCAYQLVSKDRVVEQWTCWKNIEGKTPEMKQVLVNIIRRKGHKEGYAILISELKLVASN